MRISRLFVTLLTIGAALALVVAGCGDGSSDEGAGTSGVGRLEVVATTMQLQDFTRQVGGDRANVTGILGPESEPHEYEPTPDDADALSGADVIVENGAGLDEWLADLQANAPDDAVVVSAVDGIELLPTDEEGLPGDPHVWHDPALAARMVDTIAAGLSEADPGGAATYAANAARYTREIEAMAAEVEGILAPVPPADRLLVTSHDAFGYFARAFGITQVGSVLPSVTTEAEPSAQQVQQLVDEIREAGVTVVFTEEAVDPRLEEQVADEAGATVNASLFADVLGEPGSEGATYIDAQIANARAMAEAWTTS